MVFPWFFRRISKASNARVIGYFIFCWLLTLFWPILLGFDFMEKYDQWGMVVPTIQAYHPVSHLHKFVFGMCLGRLLVDFYAVENPDNPNDGRLYISDTKVNKVYEAKLFAPIGWLVLLWLALSWQLDAFKFPVLFWPLACQELFLLPAFGLIIVGSVFKKDPITNFLCTWPLRLLDEHAFSYEIYILQGCVWTALQVVYQTAPANPNNDEHTYALLQTSTYLPILCFVGFFVNRYVTKPIAMSMAQRKR